MKTNTVKGSENSLGLTLFKEMFERALINIINCMLSTGSNHDLGENTCGGADYNSKRIISLTRKQNHMERKLIGICEFVFRKTCTCH